MWPELNVQLLKDLIRLDDGGERIGSMLDPSLSNPAFMDSRDESRAAATVSASRFIRISAELAHPTICDAAPHLALRVRHNSFLHRSHNFRPDRFTSIDS
jgi:hypothetical protein